MSWPRASSGNKVEGCGGVKRWLEMPAAVLQACLQPFMANMDFARWIVTNRAFAMTEVHGADLWRRAVKYAQWWGKEPGRHFGTRGWWRPNGPTGAGTYRMPPTVDGTLATLALLQRRLRPNAEAAVMTV